MPRHCAVPQKSRSLSLVSPQSPTNSFKMISLAIYKGLSLIESYPYSKIPGGPAELVHLATLHSSLVTSAVISFVCHSYENCRGVAQFFPFWNHPESSVCAVFASHFRSLPRNTDPASRTLAGSSSFNFHPSAFNLSSRVNARKSNRFKTFAAVEAFLPPVTNYQSPVTPAILPFP